MYEETPEELITLLYIALPEMNSVNVEDFSEEQSFKLRMEAALRFSAIKIREHSEKPEKFDAYIAERERIIREIIGIDSQLMYQGNKIFP